MSKLNYPQLSVHSCNYHTGVSLHHLFDPCETVRGFLVSAHTNRQWCIRDGG